MNNLLEEMTCIRQHRGENMASNIASKYLELRKENIKQSMGGLESIGHRQQYVDCVEGVMYYDDSKAENINATWFTFENIVNPVIWIVGGTSHTNYSELINTVKKKVRAIISLGSEQENIEMTFHGSVKEIFAASNIEEAVYMASVIAQENDMVLFSPASKDAEMSFEERGECFVEEVQKISGKA